MNFKQPDQSDNPLSPDEDRLHGAAIKRLRQEIEQGRPWPAALQVLQGLEEELQRLVADDFLKIFIAEEHFGKGRPLEDLAAGLGLSRQALQQVLAVMLEEVGREMAAQYRREIGKQSH